MILNLSPDHEVGMNCLRRIPERMLNNYVERYERGGVQRRPCLRFVDEEGRACVVGALAGAASVEEFTRTEACARFPGGTLERISRLFEDRHLTADRMYAESLLELTRRRAGRVPTPSPGLVAPITG